MRRFLLVFLVAILAGLFSVSCGAPYYEKGYRLGISNTTALGMPIIQYTEKNSWANPQKVAGFTGPGRFMQELVYTGRSGNTIKLIYREFVNDMARPSFYTDLQYDLSQSKIIVYKQYRIQVFDATNEAITYSVIADGGQPGEFGAP